MSTLKTNTLTGTTSAGSILVTGEGGSTTTNLQQGLAKVFCHFTMSSTTARDSFNISSLTDDKTGIFTLDYTNNMANVNYSPLTAGTHRDAVTEAGWVLAVQHAGSGADDQTTGELSLSSHNSSSALADTVQATMSIIGDLA